jgi:hypothetical protein
VFTVLTYTFETWVLDLETGERRFVVEGTGARYLPTGHLVYTPWRSDTERVSALWAIPFDPEHLEATGNPFPVLQGVGMPQFGAGFFDVSETGTLVYLPVREVGGGRLIVLDIGSGTQTLLGEDRLFGFPAFSPDADRLAVAVLEGGRWDIWSYDAAGGGTPSQLTTDGGNAPLWSTDGRELTYSTGRWMTRSEQPSGLVQRRLEGATAVERILDHVGYVRAFSWAPDGQGLLYYAELPETGGDIYWLRSSGDAEPFLADANLWELWGDLSPDGRWLAYAMNESAGNEIYVTAFPERSLRIVVSRNGGHNPKWTSDGCRLLYLNGAELIAVPIRLEPSPTVGTPETVYEFRTAPQTIFDPYDVHPNGERIAIVEAPVVAEDTPILVLNWFDELRRAAGR